MVSSEPIDERWYPRFVQATMFQILENLECRQGERDAQKEQFLAARRKSLRRNPVMRYPLLAEKIESINIQQQELLVLRHDIMQRETRPALQALYCARIDEKLTKATMLQAVHRGDYTEFQRRAENLYRRPQPRLFTAAVNMTLTALNQYQLTRGLGAQTATKLANMLPPYDHTAAPLTIPTEAAWQAVEQDVSPLQFLLAIPTFSGMIKAEKIRELFVLILERIGAEGWKVIIQDRVKSINIDQTSMQVNIPLHRQVRHSELQALLLHEIGTHILRRLQGEQSRLQLLGRGFANYARFEEGVATMREQSLANVSAVHPGLDRYLAVSLAYGLDGRPRDFSTLFDVLEQYYLVQALAEGQNEHEARTDAQDRAWHGCERVFRGTNANEPGVCFPRDLLYLEGNHQAWRFAAEHPDELATINVGKIDPTNPTHRQALVELGITDAALDLLP